VYLVLDDFGGSIGQAWRQTGVKDANLETVLTDLLGGQFSNPVRVIGSTPPKAGRATSPKTLPTN
jgi:hypothetical protein